jgi:hypothetical protein
MSEFESTFSRIGVRPLGLAIALCSGICSPWLACQSTFSGLTAVQWAERMRSDPKCAALLKAGAPASLDVLGALVMSQENDVASIAAQTCAEIGSVCKPIEPELLRCFRFGPSLIAKSHALAALTGLEPSSPDLEVEIRRTLAEQPVLRMRTECVQALAALGLDPLRVIADIVLRGEVTAEFACQCVLDLGPDVVTDMARWMRTEGVLSQVALEVLPRLGWRAARLLEQVGRRDLARHAWRYAVYQHVWYVDMVDWEFGVPRPTKASETWLCWRIDHELRTIVFVMASLQAAGGEVRRVSCFADGLGPNKDEIRSWLVPVTEGESEDLKRQLRQLLAVGVGARDDVVRVALVGGRSACGFVRDEADWSIFCGRKESSNLEARIIPESVSGVLDQVAHRGEGAVAFQAADRDLLARCKASIEHALSKSNRDRVWVLPAIDRCLVDK